MTKVSVLVVALVLSAFATTRAQSPNGTIAGIVTDQTGAALVGARVSIVNRGTGQTRSVTTSGAGHFSAAALPPGTYWITAEADEFKRLEREAIVEAGMTTTVDLALQIGEISDRVTVGGTQPLIRRDQHLVGGLVTREQIERLPLNGRNFLELAKLEPGVIPTRLGDGRVFVASLGGGLQTIPRIGATRVTVDGAIISTPGTVGVLLQVSQDVVQEFQIATVNFDSSSGLTSNGAINIATRSGSNDYQGGGFYFYRDHHLAAYPGLARDPTVLDPSFERKQFGVTAGGPFRKDRAFFFGSFERTDQVGVFSVRPIDEFAPLAGLFSSPYEDNQFNARIDVQLRHNHNAFGRYTYDRNTTFAPIGAAGLPSSWSRRINQSEQFLVGVTSVLSPALVNDVRVSYFSVEIPITTANAETCAGCFGLGDLRTTIANVDLIYGGAATSSSSTGRRYQLTDNVVWQRGRHELRFGVDWERGEAADSNFGLQVAQIGLFSPRQVRRDAPELPLPSSFSTHADILQLPLNSVSITVGSDTALWQGFRRKRSIDLYRLYFADTWRRAPRMTLNYGLGWSYEPNALNHDLTKPALLTSILGADGLRPPEAQKRNFSPALGFAWTATGDGKTLVRGGAGRYFDPAGSGHALNLISERKFLAPLGTGTLTRTGANILYEDRPLFFPSPTSFTGAHLLAILPSMYAELERSLNPNNRDFTLRNLDRTKEGMNLHDPSNRTPYAVHAGLGVQRELAEELLVSADIVWKRFVHTFINGIDYNRWNSLKLPVIPKCSGAQSNDVHAACSNGSLYFDTTIGRARYLGLLLRAEKRFSRRTQLLASYALGSFVGSNGTGTGTSEAPAGRVFGFNNDNWFENYGPLPTDQRHILNLSGFIELPKQLQLAVSISASSATPFAPYVRDMDFNGDGTVHDLLPGTTINEFGRALDKDDLANLVDRYNEQFARRQTAGGRTAPILTLPDNVSFNDGFFTQDLRLTRRFNLGSKGQFATAFAEIFNVLNTANLVGFGSNLAQPSSFGQPNARFSQVFGSGGPRAFQLGARLTF
jgi:Carboxypeptidase regulatory-like domain